LRSTPAADPKARRSRAVPAMGAMDGSAITMVTNGRAVDGPRSSAMEPHASGKKPGIISSLVRNAELRSSLIGSGALRACSVPACAFGAMDVSAMDGR
jgi:hypothetical protein